MACGSGCGLIAAFALWAVLGAGMSVREHGAAAPAAAAGVGTERPIIGILSQEISPKVRELYDPEGKFKSYIAASYVKYIEASGARVVPILCGQPRDYYTRMAKSVNGVLLPGGATFLDPPDGYGASGQAMYEEAVRINGPISAGGGGGGHLPVLGICLGMELIAVEAGGGIGKDLRVHCESHDQQLPLEFTADASHSRLFGGAPEIVREILRSQNVTVNQHKYCVTEEQFRERGLLKNWKILSKNRDADGKVEFISSFEAKDMPIFGVQFHPEKNIYEWKKDKKYAHSADAVLAARYFADFLVSEARKSNQTFLTETEEYDSLIYNFHPTYTGRHLIFEQLYFFEHDVVNTREKGENSPVASAYFYDTVSSRDTEAFN